MRSSAMRKIPGSGLATPTTVESMMTSNRSPKPAAFRSWATVPSDPNTTRYLALPGVPELPRVTALPLGEVKLTVEGSREL